MATVESNADIVMKPVSEESVEKVVEQDKEPGVGDGILNSADKDEKMYKFPLGRVKNMMKLDPDVTMASQEAVFAVTKAIELFVESLAVEAYSYTTSNKKKTISKADVETAIDNVDCLAFLDGAMDD